MVKHFYSFLVLFFIGFLPQSKAVQLGYVAVTNVSCANAGDGSICWTVINGSSPYFISILNSSVSNASSCAQNLLAGVYTLTITDAGGNSTSSAVTVGVNSPSLKIIASDSSVCLGDSVTLSPIFNSNGVIGSGAYCKPFFASIDGANISNVTFGTINNSSSCGTIAGYGSKADKYSIYTNISTTITKSTSIPFSIQVDSCYQQGNQGNSVAIYIDYNADGDFTDANEIAYISPNAIAGPHTESGNVFVPNNLQKGIARMRVVVANVVPAQLDPCGIFVNGEAEDYTLFFEATPLSIYWQSNIYSAAGTTFNITPSIDTTFVLSIDYNVGCTDSAIIDLHQNNQPNALILSTNIACANASLQALTGNGTPPYIYTWMPGNIQTQSITGLVNGTYSVVIQDSLGCKDSTTYPVTLVPSMASFPTVVNVKCFGDANGSIHWNVAGGTPAYIYQWSPPVTSASQKDSLNVGTYSVIVTDANGCTYTKSATISQPLSPLNVLVAKQNISSYTATDGSAKVTATGGTGPYTYKWKPSGEIVDSITGKGLGVFTITVTDSNGCTTNEIVAFTAVGITEIDKLYNLSIVPNPANENITISADKIISSIQIVDALGKIVLNKKTNSKVIRIPVDQFADGIYLVSINGVLNRKISILK